MPRTGENIRKRKDGRWEARYIRARTPEGKAVYRSVYGKTYREVKEKMVSARSALPAPKAPIAGNAVTVGSLIRGYLESSRMRYKESTLLKYESLCSVHIEPVIGDMNTMSLSAETVNRFLREKFDTGRTDGKGGLSAASVSGLGILLCAAHSYGVKNELCLPFRTSVIKPAISDSTTAVLSRSEQRILEEKLSKTSTATALCILISLYAGLRIGEVCALKWEDIDLETGVLHVNHTVIRVKKDDVNGSYLKMDVPKTRQSLRMIPIAKQLFSILTVQQKDGNVYVASENTAFLNPATLQYRFHKLMEEAGLPDINYHALRHTFATRCIENGIDVKTLSEMLGHADAKITLNRYVHSSMENMRKQMENLNLD